LVTFALIIVAIAASYCLSMDWARKRPALGVFGAVLVVGLIIVAISTFGAGIPKDARCGRYAITALLLLPGVAVAGIIVIARRVTQWPLVALVLMLGVGISPLLLMLFVRRMLC
jgi:hypothetical protein